MIRPNPADKPDDGRRGRRGWSGASRRRINWGDDASAPSGQPDETSAWSPTSGLRSPPGLGPPGARRYPWQDDPDYSTNGAATRRPPPGAPPRQAPSAVPPRMTLPPPSTPEPEAGPEQGASQPPRKITVTRVAAWRIKNLTKAAVTAFRQAAHADGADKSGLAKLTYAVMMNYAVDAAIAVALANTLFFSAATAESKTKVALYLLITAAPFAIIAPVIGPALDRLQHGRRAALAVSFGLRLLLLIVMALHFDDWMLYPAALGCMVLSRSFGVLKAAVTPRVLPDITLVKTNSRLTVFGLVAGGVVGAVAIGIAQVFGSPGTLWFTAAACVPGAWLCLRIPAWVEVTEGEVPASLRAHPHKPQRQLMGRHVVVSLWGNGTIRVLTGFLTLFAAFVIKTLAEHEPLKQLLLLGMIGAAAGAGNFLGNGIGARLHFGKPDQVVISCVGATLVATVLAALVEGIGTVAVLGLVGSTASALAKVCLDAVVQREMPEESRASAFGRSETILQMGWVLGGALGVLLPAKFWLGFAVLSGLLALGLAQTVLSQRGTSMIPGLGGDRPEHPAATNGFGREERAHPGPRTTPLAHPLPAEPDRRPPGPTT